MKKVNWGWMQWAQKKIVDKAGRLKYVVQSTTWIDCKQVGVLHNWLVGPPSKTKTFHNNRATRQREPVMTHPIIPDYIRHMRGMDRFDQSMNAYNISQRGNRWYLRIFYWHVNAALANMRTVTKAIVPQSNCQRESMRTTVGLDSHGMRKDSWDRHVNNQMGWFHWMINLGHGLVARGIAMDWTDMHHSSTRPKWMQQKPLKPCSCKRCIFCKDGLASSHGLPRQVSLSLLTPPRIVRWLSSVSMSSTQALPMSPDLSTLSQPSTMVATT
jgi:hypothetical protein